ncbi:MAG: PaaX family transcriptional regulator C-terminal domain-containing protein [Rhizobiaceae bacterium]
MALYNTPMTSDELPLVDYTISALAHSGQTKVWSVIVTVFGDLAKNPGDEISGPLLSIIMEKIGIRPEAMRVAIHRLRKDKWIESRREGRVSKYRLSAKGFAESEAARPRIYATVQAFDQSSSKDWHLSIQEPAKNFGLTDANQIEIVPGVLLGTGQTKQTPTGAFVVQFSDYTLPEWVKQKILPDALLTAYEQFQHSLTEIFEELNGQPRPNRLEAAIVRILIIHNWRRLLLRHSEATDNFFPDGWVGRECRQLVTSILEKLPDNNLTALSHELETGTNIRNQ